MSNQNMTKAERREAAREKARKIQEAEAKRAKRNKILTILIIVVAVALVGVAIWSIVANKSDDESSSRRQQWDPVSVDVEPVVKPDTDVTTGYSIIGAGEEFAADAPRVDIYFDYMCSYCNDLEQFNGADINDLVASGDAQFVLHPVAILRGDFSAQGAAAFKYIAEKSPEHLLAFHKNVFAATDEVLNGRSSTMPDWSTLTDAAKDAGVPADIVSSMEADADLEWAQTTTQKFLEDYRGTPTVLVNGTQTDAWAGHDFPGMLGLAEPKGESETE